MAELGVKTQAGKLVFKPYLLHKDEFLQTTLQAHFVLVDGSSKSVQLEKNMLAFTVCQVPVVYTISNSNYIEVGYANGTYEVVESLELSKEISKQIFQRTNTVAHIKVFLTEAHLK